MGLIIFDILDCFFAAESLVNLFYDPSLESLLFATIDTVALLPLIPSSGYARKGAKVVDELSDAVHAASVFRKLQYAEKYGINSYHALRRALISTDLQAHHIIEKRFARMLGINVGDMLSVAVTKEEHQMFTKAWRQAIPYGTDYNSITVSQLWDAAKQIYKDYPDLLDAAKRTLYPKGVR